MERKEKREWLARRFGERVGVKREEKERTRDQKSRKKKEEKKKGEIKRSDWTRK